MDIAQLISIFISAVFVHNVILSRFLGLCPFIAISKESKPALAMSLAVSFVIIFSSAITWCVYRFLLVRFDLVYLRTVFFILVIASWVQFIEMAIKKISPALYRSFGIYLALITTNCAVLGVAVLNVESFFVNGQPIRGSFFYSLFQAFCVSLGYSLAMFLMSGIRERLEVCDVPKSLRGFPIAFIVAALMSMSFLAFSGFRF